MAIDDYTAVSSCSVCERYGTFPKLKRELQLLLANGSLEFVAIDILGPLHCTVNGNQYVIVTDDIN